MSIVKQRIQESIAVKNTILNDNAITTQIESVAQLIIEKIKAGGSIYFCGNGGSAADAQHLAAELSGRFCFDRKPLSAEALHCNTSFLTAVANDYSFDSIYSRLITGVGRKGDVLLGLSTSGNSQNIINAFEQAHEMDIYTIAFAGATGGKMKSVADTCICVPSTQTARIQEAHIMVGHIVCEIIEATLFENPNK